MLVRCPVVGQQVCSQLQMSLDCTSGNGLVKSFTRDRILHEKGGAYFSLGLQFSRQTDVASAGALTLERHYRAGFPLMAGLRLNEFCSIEAGGFFGFDVARPQQSFWFDRPELQGLGATQLAPRAGLMFGVGMELPSVGRLNVRVLAAEQPEMINMGNLQVGWSCRW